MNRALMATAVAAGMAGAGCAEIVPQKLGISLTPQPLTDPVVFNFALNLEYLEAEYYQRGVNGISVPDEHVGPNPGAVNGGRQVAFQTPYLREFMAEIANDELNHVRFLRHAIAGSPLVEMGRPTIDLQGSFQAAGKAAGLGDGFDPFADETSFLLGAFLFEDVGVTAYHGAAKLLSGGETLAAAAGILAVEAYHGALIRTQIAESGDQVIHAANAISAARDALDGPAQKEQAVTIEDGRYIIAPSDPNGIAFERTPQQVLNVVYLSADPDVRKGGFFPDGVRGIVHHT